MASRADITEGNPVHRIDGGAQQDCAPTPEPNAMPSADRSLWLWVGAAFLFLALLWTAMVFAAGAADSRTVPLPAKEARP